ncbi:WLM domain-containing protein [Lentinula edodes]|uniref:WLM domain-containing protein n=1 Tax=Lentinula edodes TaxID=5353 RepID=UPI001E8E0AE8|nr:WLM domain-containing protein [Lentinula edodes]KAH7870638.1 WLM domain-containing protein [Lentinula edodes]
MNLTVSHRGQSYSLSLLPDDTLAVLHARLEELTSTPPQLQKLLYKGKNSKALDDQVTLIQAGLKDGMKIQMLGTTANELDGVKAVEDDQQKRDRIMKERALRGPTKLRSTGSGSSGSDNLNYRFHKLIPLPHLPNPSSALDLLQRLSDDPAIRHVMQKHKFVVGVLTELAPHEHPELLGLNENAGQQIKLRLRTDRYDGFRTYKEVRRVLCHELTHNVWGDHDNNFKELNSLLNREVGEYEASVKAGTNVLGYSGEVYEQSESGSRSHGSHVLGGSGSDAILLLNDSTEDRRRRALEAAERRLRQEEEEMENSCGTAGHSAVAE